MFKLVRVRLQGDGGGGGGGDGGLANQNADWEVVIPEDPLRKLDYVDVFNEDRLLVEYFDDVKVRPSVCPSSVPSFFPTKYRPH
jgi:hypothetical protein